MSDEKNILSGLKVLEVATWVFGPASATVMSDFGAQVIKVENPAIGDPYRYLSQMVPMPASEHNYCWILDGRNKRSIALNLKEDEAREVLYKLTAEADVFITNYPPGVLETLGITYKDIGPLNDKLIYAQASGFGENGPAANKPGYDATAWWAGSGLMDTIRAEGSDPSLSVAGMGDHPSAMSLFGGIMMGLYQRERTGKGCKVHSSLMANGAWSYGCFLQAALCGCELYERSHRLEPRNALVNLYATGDDRFFLLALTQGERDWPIIAKALGRQELIEDPRFATESDRHANAPELAGILDAEFTSRDLEAVRTLLDEHNLTFGAVNRLQDLPDDPQMKLNDIFIEIKDERVGTLRTINSPIWVEGQTKEPPRLAPEIGEHTDQILCELGYDEATINTLRDAGAIR